MSELDKAVQNLKADMDGPSRTLALAMEGRVVVDRAELAAVLDRLAELEAAVKPEPDTLSNLKVGDKVEVLIDWATVYKGTLGTVSAVIPDEYCIRVALPGRRSSTGFRRSELSKVAE